MDDGCRSSTEENIDAYLRWIMKAMRWWNFKACCRLSNVARNTDFLTWTNMEDTVNGTERLGVPFLFDQLTVPINWNKHIKPSCYKLWCLLSQGDHFCPMWRLRDCQSARLMCKIYLSGDCMPVLGLPAIVSYMWRQAAVWKRLYICMCL